MGLLTHGVLRGEVDQGFSLCQDGSWSFAIVGVLRGLILEKRISCGPSNTSELRVSNLEALFHVRIGDDAYSSTLFLLICRVTEELATIRGASPAPRRALCLCLTGREEGVLREGLRGLEVVLGEVQRFGVSVGAEGLSVRGHG